MPRGRAHASWLRKVESYLKDAGMAGLASAWAMARQECRREVDAATRWSGVCPHTDLIVMRLIVNYRIIIITNCYRTIRPLIVVENSRNY